MSRLPTAPGRYLGAAGWLLVSFLLAACPVLAADPTASPATGDVRTSSTAPGLVGDPLFALAGVVVIGLIAVGATLLYVRLTSRP
jgi:hypothetical protein